MTPETVAPRRRSGATWVGVKLVDRYVATVLGQQFAYALAALLAIFSMIDLTEELRQAGTHAYGVFQALSFVLLTLPAQAYELLPAAALLGAVMGLGQMASQNELIALSAAGVSTRRLAVSVLGAASLLGALGTGFGELVAAPLSQQARATRALALTGGHTLSTASGLWLRDGPRFVNVGLVYPNGSLGELYLFELDDQRALRRFTYARSAALDGADWALRDVTENAVGSDSVVAKHLATAAWDAPIDAAELRTLWLQPQDLSIGELVHTISALEQRQQNPLAYRLALWHRLSSPVYTVLMVLLALPVVEFIRPRGGRGERLVVGIVLGLGFHLLHRMFMNVALVYGLSPLITALVPAGLALATAAVLYKIQRVA